MKLAKDNKEFTHIDINRIRQIRNEMGVWKDNRKNFPLEEDLDNKVIELTLRELHKIEKYLLDVVDVKGLVRISKNYLVIRNKGKLIGGSHKMIEEAQAFIDGKDKPSNFQIVDKE